jgi:hypothetical protein
MTVDEHIAAVREQSVSLGRWNGWEQRRDEALVTEIEFLRRQNAGLLSALCVIRDAAANGDWRDIRRIADEAIAP